MAIKKIEEILLKDYEGKPIEVNKPHKIMSPLPYPNIFNSPGDSYLSIEPQIILITEIGKDSVFHTLYYIKIITLERKEYTFTDNPPYNQFATSVAGSLKKATVKDIQKEIGSFKDRLGQLEKWLKLIDT